MGCLSECHQKIYTKIKFPPVFSSDFIETLFETAVLGAKSIKWGEKERHPRLEGGQLEIMSFKQTKKASERPLSESRQKNASSDNLLKLYP